MCIYNKVSWRKKYIFLDIRVIKISKSVYMIVVKQI
jgi:hypothetical protein